MDRSPREGGGASRGAPRGRRRRPEGERPGRDSFQLEGRAPAPTPPSRASRTEFHLDLDGLMPESVDADCGVPQDPDPELSGRLPSMGLPAPPHPWAPSALASALVARRRGLVLTAVAAVAFVWFLRGADPGALVVERSERSGRSAPELVTPPAAPPRQRSGSAAPSAPPARARASRPAPVVLAAVVPAVAPAPRPAAPEPGAPVAPATPAVDAVPWVDESDFLLAGEYRQAGDARSAERIYRDLIAVGFQRARAEQELGDLCFEAGRYEEAKEHYGRAAGLFDAGSP